MSLQELIQIVIGGNREDVRAAQKRIEKYWEQRIRSHRTFKAKKDYAIFLEQIGNFENIKSLDNQVAFIGILKWPFLSIGETNFEFFAQFILKAIQHPSGKIRQAILNAVDWLTISCHLEPEDFYDRRIGKAELETMQRNKNIYFETVKKVEDLLDKYYKPRFGRYKYIDRMPPSIYKSLQYLLVVKLLRTEKYEHSYEQFLHERYGLMPKYTGAQFSDTTEDASDEELDRIRNGIEIELTQLLRESKSDFELEDIKEIIYKENDKDDFMKIVSMFDQGQSPGELQRVLEAISDAWNFFPHANLGGQSPVEAGQLLN